MPRILSKVKSPLQAANTCDAPLDDCYQHLLPVDAVTVNNIKDGHLAEILKEVIIFHVVATVRAKVTNTAAYTLKNKNTGITSLWINGSITATDIANALKEIILHPEMNILYGTTENILFVTTKKYSPRKGQLLNALVIALPNQYMKIYIC